MQEIARLMYDCWAYDPKERPDFRTIARTIEQVLGTWRSLHAPPRPHINVSSFRFVSSDLTWFLFLRCSSFSCADSNLENYSIVPNTGEPISCTHPKRQGSAKPAPLPRPTTTGQ